MTDLATIVSSYREQGAENLNAFGPWLSFTSGEKFTPSMHFVSDEYPGEYFPNGNALVYGPMDSFSALKDSGDICDEHFAFDHRPGYGEVLDEAWFDCSEGIRTVLLRTRTDYGQGVGVLYNYQLRVLGYARLQNGFFDHALITRFFGTIQVPREDLGLEDFLSHPQVGISSEAFWKARGEIAAFVESIRSFVPLPRPLAAWEEPEGEEPDIRAIRQYYHRIGTGDLQGAYDLTAPKKAGFETFRSWYQTAILARPRDFTMIEPRTYRYFVDYQDHNHDPVVYRVVAKITDTGIETLSSEMLKSDIVTHGDMAAYTRERLGKSGVILIDGDEEIIVEEGVAPDPTEDNIRAVHYLHPRFSASGRYFLYEVTGWEWHAFVIYDAQQRKIVLRYDGWGEPSFTPGESYVFSCAAAGMSAPNGFVYSTEDWTELFDATKLIEEEYARFECFYDVHTSAIHFTARRGFSDEEGGDEIVAEITFDTVKREAKRLR